MILRWIVFGIITWLLVIAVFISLKAKPLGATAIVCNPTLVPNAAEKLRKVQRA